MIIAFGRVSVLLLHTRVCVYIYISTCGCGKSVAEIKKGLSAPFRVTLQLNVTRACGLRAKTKRDASTTRECVSHLLEKGEMAAIAKIFDLLLVAQKGKRSTREQNSAAATGSEQERKHRIRSFLHRDNRVRNDLLLFATLLWIYNKTALNVFSSLFTLSCNLHVFLCTSAAKANATLLTSVAFSCRKNIWKRCLPVGWAPTVTVLMEPTWLAPLIGHSPLLSCILSPLQTSPR